MDIVGEQRISADSHVIEPRDLWEKYIAPAFRARAPHVERVSPTKDVFVVAGLGERSMTVMASAGMRDEEFRHSISSLYEEMLHGGWDPHARITDMERDGVFGEVVYPTLGMWMLKIDDAEFLRACAEAYNSWVADFCNACPDRLKGLALLSLDDPEWAAKELRRAAGIGLAGALVPATPPAGTRYDSTAFDAVWAVADELGLPVSLHTNTGRTKQMAAADDPEWSWWSSYAMLPRFIGMAITDMIFGRVFERFPNLKIVSAEADAAWVGNWFERLDHFYKRYRYSRDEHLADDMLPSEVFRRHCYATFIRDECAIALRDNIGVENIMWSNDYPHSDSSWPQSQAVLDKHLRGVSDDDRHKIVYANAASLYGF